MKLTPRLSGLLASLAMYQRAIPYIVPRQTSKIVLKMTIVLCHQFLCQYARNFPSGPFLKLGPSFFLYSGSGFGIYYDGIYIMKTKHRVSIVIPVYNEQDHLAACLEAIA